MNSQQPSAKKKKHKDDASCAVTPKPSGSKTPVHQPNMAYQSKTPGSQKSGPAKIQTPSYSRNKQDGPYIQYETPSKKAGDVTIPAFDRTCAEEGPVRKMNLPDFTYYPKPMETFSSNNVEPPMNAPTGPRAEIHKLINSTQQGSLATPVAGPSNSSETDTGHNARALTVAVQSQSVQEIVRKSLSVFCKTQVMELCLSMKGEYLRMPAAIGLDQEPFWAQLLEKIPQNITADKLKVPKDIRDAVEAWCQPRRSLLREGTLPAVSPAQPELDGLIDSWNKVFAERFCQLYRGYLESVVWSTPFKSEINHMVKTKVEDWISNSLKKRRSELGRFDQPSLLKSGSSSTDYYNATKGLQNQLLSAKRDNTQITETEAVMSIIDNLRPDLMSAISHRLNRNRINNVRKARQEGNNSQSPSQESGCIKGSTAEPNAGTRPGVDTRDVKVAFKIPKSSEPQKNTTSLWTERREPRNSETNYSTTSSNLPAKPPPVQKREELTRKRNISDTPEVALVPSRDLYTSGRASNATGQNDTKRPRIDERKPPFVESDLPPASDFCFTRRGQCSPRHRQHSPPRRSRWDRSDEKKAQRNSNYVPLGARTPGRPASPESARKNVPLGSRTPRPPASPERSNRNQVSLGSRTPRRPCSPERGNRNDIPFRPRTPRRPASPGPRDRNDMPYRPRSPRRSVSPRRGRDTWYRQRSISPVSRFQEEGRHRDRWRPDDERPREWRENTVEFSRMPTERQNVSLRREMKEMKGDLKALLKKGKQ
ncbi:hypothetical protein ACHAPU_010723 [Fusarium lateritium]